MELMQYWRIVRSRWWLIGGLLLIVGVVSATTYDWSPAPMFSATFRFNVGLEPVPPDNTVYEYNPLDVWQTSEYFMDDLASAVRGADYARRVARRLAEDGVNLAGAFSSTTEHRVLTVTVVWGDSEQLARIVNEAVHVLQEEGDELVGALGHAQPMLRLIDPPTVLPAGQSLKDKLDIPIRLGLALVAGVAGAFLLDYLDMSVRDSGEIEAMGIQVLAQIPRHR
jgi:capsular polysaccharide biosynthesis protein